MFDSDVAFIFDTDATLQLLIANQHNLFRILKEDFAVSSFVMSEVEVELRSNPKFSGLVKPQFDKALKNRWINLLSATHLDAMTPANGATGSVGLAEIRSLGAEYNLHVQTGEAYTFAAATLLGVPTVSNDMNAIRTLEQRGLELPMTILRSFDIFGFAYVEKYLSEPEVEQVRKTLKAYAEWVPACMKNCSFVEGLDAMHCRLNTSLGIASSATSWSAPFFLKRKTLDPPA